MPRLLKLLPLLALIAGCRGGEPPPAELPRAGMKPILRVAAAHARAGAAATVEQAAVLKALELSNTAYAERWDALTPETNPSEYREKFADYVKVLREHDVKDTSLEFRGAWKRYLESWDKFLGELRATPDGLYKDVEFMEALHAAFGVGGKDAVRGLSADAINAAAKLKETLNKLYTAADSAGVVAEASAL